MKKLFWGIVFLVYVLLANMLLFYVSTTNPNTITFIDDWAMVTNLLVSFIGAFIFRLPKILERSRGERGKVSLDFFKLILGFVFLFVALSKVWMYTIFAWAPINLFFGSLASSSARFLQTLCAFVAGLFFIDCVKRKKKE